MQHGTIYDRHLSIVKSSYSILAIEILFSDYKYHCSSCTNRMMQQILKPFGYS